MVSSLSSWHLDLVRVRMPTTSLSSWHLDLVRVRMPAS